MTTTGERQAESHDLIDFFDPAARVGETPAIRQTAEYRYVADLVERRDAKGVARWMRENRLLGPGESVKEVYAKIPHPEDIVQDPDFVVVMERDPNIVRGPRWSYGQFMPTQWVEQESMGEKYWKRTAGEAGATIDGSDEWGWQAHGDWPHLTPGEPLVILDDRFPTLEAAKAAADDALEEWSRRVPGQDVMAEAGYLEHRYKVAPSDAKQIVRELEELGFHADRYREGEEEGVIVVIGPGAKIAEADALVDRYPSQKVSSEPYEGEYWGTMNGHRRNGNGMENWTAKDFQRERGGLDWITNPGSIPGEVYEELVPKGWDGPFLAAIAEAGEDAPPEKKWEAGVFDVPGDEERFRRIGTFAEIAEARAAAERELGVEAGRTSFTNGRRNGREPGRGVFHKDPYTEVLEAEREELGEEEEEPLNGHGEGRVIARWEAAKGKRFVELLHQPDGTYSYRTEGGAGHGFTFDSDEAAISWAESPWKVPGGAGPVTVLKTDFPSVRRVPLPANGNGWHDWRERKDFTYQGSINKIIGPASAEPLEDSEELDTFEEAEKWVEEHLETLSKTLPREEWGDIEGQVCGYPEDEFGGSTYDCDEYPMAQSVGVPSNGNGRKRGGRPKSTGKGVLLDSEPEGLTPEWAIWFECDGEGYPEENCMPDRDHPDHDKWHKKEVAVIGRKARVKVDDLLERRDPGGVAFYEEFARRLALASYDVYNSDSRFEVYLPGETPKEERAGKVPSSKPVPEGEPVSARPSGKIFETEPDYTEDVEWMIWFECVEGDVPGESCAPQEPGPERTKWLSEQVRLVGKEAGLDNGFIEEVVATLGRKGVIEAFQLQTEEEREAFNALTRKLAENGFGVYYSDTRFLVWKPGQIPEGESVEGANGNGRKRRKEAKLIRIEPKPGPEEIGFQTPAEYFRKKGLKVMGSTDKAYYVTKIKKKNGADGGIMEMDEFRRGYVDAYYPGLTGYSYKAEWITPDEGRAAMKAILREVDFIEEPHGGLSAPVLHLKDGSALFVQDSNDFPVPSAEEPVEGNGRHGRSNGNRAAVPSALDLFSDWIVTLARDGERAVKEGREVKVGFNFGPPQWKHSREVEVSVEPVGKAKGKPELGLEGAAYTVDGKPVGNIHGAAQALRLISEEVGVVETAAAPARRPLGRTGEAIPTVRAELPVKEYPSVGAFGPQRISSNAGPKGLEQQFVDPVYGFQHEQGIKRETLDKGPDGKQRFSWWLQFYTHPGMRRQIPLPTEGKLIAELVDRMHGLAADDKMWMKFHTLGIHPDGFSGAQEALAYLKDYAVSWESAEPNLPKEALYTKPGWHEALEAWQKRPLADGDGPANGKRPRSAKSLLKDVLDRISGSIEQNIRLRNVNLTQVGASSSIGAVNYAHEIGVLDTKEWSALNVPLTVIESVEPSKDWPAVEASFGELKRAIQSLKDGSGVNGADGMRPRTENGADGHTPGPWEWQGERLVGAEKRPVLETKYHWLTGKEAEANARLIAAAPDLLYHLDALASIREELRIAEDLAPGRVLYIDRLFRQAKAAIAKGRGGSNGHSNGRNGNGTYEGWSNRATWATNLWLANEEPAYRRVVDMAKRASSVPVLADEIKDFVEQDRPELKGYWGDLLSAGWASIDWVEVARDWFAEYGPKGKEEKKRGGSNGNGHSNGHNGTDKEFTHLVHVWLSNDEPLYNEATSLGRREHDRYKLGRAIKAMLEEAKPDVPGLWADLIRYGLDSVSWDEIAEAFLPEEEEEGGSNGSNGSNGSKSRADISAALEETIERMAKAHAAEAWSTPGDQMTEELGADVWVKADFGGEVAVNGDLLGPEEVPTPPAGFTEAPSHGGRVPTTEQEISVEHAVRAVARRLKVSEERVSKVAKDEGLGELVYRSVSGDTEVWAKADGSNGKGSAPSVDKLATAFSVEIRKELTPEEVAEVDRVNAERGFSLSDCATQDVCDANLAMAAAFKTVYGREVDVHNEADIAAWNAAWAVAKRRGFKAANGSNGHKPTIWYAGQELFFKEEVESIDAAQTIIDGWKSLGLAAAALHEGGKHQVYVAKPSNGSNGSHKEPEPEIEERLKERRLLGKKAKLEAELDGANGNGKKEKWKPLKKNPDSLKWMSDWDPAGAEFLQERWDREILESSGARSFRELKTAMDRVYWDGYMGPLSDDDWAEQDGRTCGGSSKFCRMADAKRIVGDALDASLGEHEFYNPEGEPAGYEDPETQRTFATTADAEAEGVSTDALVDLPNAKVDGDDYKKEVFKFVREIYGRYGLNGHSNGSDGNGHDVEWVEHPGSLPGTPSWWEARLGKYRLAVDYEPGPVMGRPRKYEWHVKDTETGSTLIDGVTDTHSEAQEEAVKAARELLAKNGSNGNGKAKKKKAAPKSKTRKSTEKLAGQHPVWLRNWEQGLPIFTRKFGPVEVDDLAADLLGRGIRAFAMSPKGRVTVEWSTKPEEEGWIIVKGIYAPGEEAPKAKAAVAPAPRTIDWEGAKWEVDLEHESLVNVSDPTVVFDLRTIYGREPYGGRGEEIARQMSMARGDAPVDPKELFIEHRLDAEPLSYEQTQAISKAGFSFASEWDQRGGGLHWHNPTWPNQVWLADLISELPQENREEGKRLFAEGDAQKLQALFLRRIFKADNRIAYLAPKGTKSHYGVEMEADAVFITDYPDAFREMVAAWKGSEFKPGNGNGTARGRGRLFDLILSNDEMYAVKGAVEDVVDHRDPADFAPELGLPEWEFLKKKVTHWVKERLDQPERFTDTEGRMMIWALSNLEIEKPNDYTDARKEVEHQMKKAGIAKANGNGALRHWPGTPVLKISTQEMGHVIREDEFASYRLLTAKFGDRDEPIMLDRPPRPRQDYAWWEPYGKRWINFGGGIGKTEQGPAPKAQEQAAA